MLREFINIWKSDNLLKQAWDESFEMLDIDQEMFLEAVRILRESDHTQVDQEIRRKDKMINRYEQDVRRKVMTHCTLQGPNELPSGMVLVSIVIDIERIGDFCKNIVDLAVTFPRQLQGGTFEEDVQQIEKAVKYSFVQTKTCLESSDGAAALQLLQEYRWVNRLCEECVMGLIHEKDKEIRPGEAVALALYLRWLKRINAHLRNIASSVVNPFDRLGFKPKKKP
ncbi:MAG TPA: hypothetical protein EYP19_12835 [Desulfobacterales bacterium]|nr:hypothetical protein [Desulfobacterales bacterium]